MTIQGSFGDEPPTQITDSFTFSVTTSTSTPKNYDIDAVLEGGGKRDVITQLTAMFVDESSVRFEYDIRPVEIDVPPGQYELKVVATPTFGGDSGTVIASKQVTLGSGPSESDSRSGVGDGDGSGGIGGGSGQDSKRLRNLAIVGSGAAAALWFVRRQS